MTQMTRIKLLTSKAEIATAMRLLSEQIPEVELDRIGHDEERTTRACKTFLRSVVAPTVGEADAVMVPHIWIGAVAEGRMVGAVHAAADTRLAYSHIRAYAGGVDGAGIPPWIHRLLNVTASVEEIAVEPHARGSGVGRSLLDRVHARLREHRVPGPWNEERATHTWAAAAAHPLFESAGYIVAPPRQPVPPEYVGDAPLLWDPEYDERDGAHCYGFLSDLS